MDKFTGKIRLDGLYDFMFDIYDGISNSYSGLAKIDLLDVKSGVWSFYG